MLGKLNKSNPTDHLVRWLNKSLHITLMIGILVGVGLFVSPENTYAHHDDNDLIKTVFHVYLDGEKIGTVHHQEAVEKYLNQRMVAAESKVQNHVSFNENIEYVSERMFQPKFNTDEVIKALDKKLSVAVEAAAITIDGQVVAYLKNEEIANGLLNELKLEYVSEDVLKQTEQLQEQKNQPLQTVLNSKDKLNDSNILDVTFSKNVTVSTENTSIGNIMSPEDVTALLKKGAVEEKVHVVESGEVLGGIAAKYDLTTSELLDLNEGIEEDGFIHIGDELVVTGFEPYLKVIVKEVVTKEEEIGFKTAYETSNSIFKGVSKTKQDGKPGLKKVKYEIVKENGKVVNKKVLDSEVLSEPVKKIVVRGTKVVPSRGTGEFAWPAVGGYISSYMGTRWGSYHKGIDIARPSNRAIKAADNGTITFAGWSGGYGNRIIISHNNGYKTTYSHMSSLKVSVGQTVQRGQQIGVMGRTGNSTGIHLHFEVYKNGSLINPMSVLNH
jgi:murein DD-endopeptidase MepM/ murein hydrolase activator NlpD